MTTFVTYPQVSIAHLVVGPALVVDDKASIREAAVALRAMNSSAALVGGPESIVTERDLTRAWSQGFSGEELVATVASAHPIVVGSDMSMLDAAALMLNQEIRHLIVVERQQVGIVSLRTVMAVLLQAVRPEIWLSVPKTRLSQESEIWLG